MRQTSDPDARFSPLDALSGAERWLDDHGKGAWIAAIVLGFFAFWPLGLGLLLYVTVIRKNLRRARGDELPELRRLRYRGPRSRPAPPPPPAADEQQQFESFRARLRSEAGAEDFDAYLDRRAAETATTATAAPAPEPPQAAPEPPPAPPAPFSGAGPRVLEEPARRPAPPVRR